MLKAGWIGAVLGFIYITSLNLISPLCTLCVTPLLGLGVGYLAAWFDAPKTLNVCLGRGAISGIITGLTVIFGQMVAAFTNAVIVTHLDNWPDLIAQWGLSPVIMSNDEYWQSVFLLNTFCSLLNLGVIVGLATVGSFIWFRAIGNKSEGVRNTE